jgi:hypothetical protein
MDRAFLVFEKDGKEYRLKVTEGMYQEFKKSNPALEHRLECPDYHCRGRVHAHIEARNRRAGATHAYTERGFTHNAHAASKNCEYSFKDDPRFAELPDTRVYAQQTKELVDAAFDKYEMAIRKTLRVLLGRTADVGQHFTAMRTRFDDHEFYATHARAAPYVYVTTLGPFEMTLKKGDVITATYLENDQQLHKFKSLRGHMREEWLPRAAQLVYVPSLMPVLTYNFGIGFGIDPATHKEITRIFRNTAPIAPRGRGVLPERIIEVRPDDFVQARLQRGLKFGS